MVKNGLWGGICAWSPWFRVGVLENRLPCGGSETSCLPNVFVSVPHKEFVLLGLKWDL